MYDSLTKKIASVWSSTDFECVELVAFAERKTIQETRRGLAMMCAMAIIILIAAAALQVIFEPEQLYLYTSAILIVLSINILFASKAVNDLKALHLLGITLLVISATAFVLLAHYHQTFTPMLFASIAMLFVIVPMIPWGLREALAVTLVIYTMLTLSTLGTNFAFEQQSLWTLQFLMIGIGMVSVSLVARNVHTRKHDLENQFNLIKAHEEISGLSNRDPLTGAWNRRFFDKEFFELLHKWRGQQSYIHFMLMDIDDFKDINDNHGHEWGDCVLSNVRDAFNPLIASNGALVRMGGDEFVLVFAELDPLKVAEEGIQRFTALNQKSKPSYKDTVGLSIGVATVPTDVEIVYRQLYKQADMALYMAKNNKGDDVPVPNIVISTLTNPEDIEYSTIQLWNSATS